MKCVVWFVFGEEGLLAQDGDEDNSSVSGQGFPEISGPTFLDQHLDWFDCAFASWRVEAEEDGSLRRRHV